MKLTLTLPILLLPLTSLAWKCPAPVGGRKLVQKCCQATYPNDPDINGLYLALECNPSDGKPCGGLQDRGCCVPDPPKDHPWSCGLPPGDPKKPGPCRKQSPGGFLCVPSGP